VRPLAASRDITLEVDSGVLDDYVIADRQRMNQVLHNLLSNAIKYNRLGGRVSVSTQHQSGGRLRISVNDTGMGLRQEQLGRLFQPFERLGAEQTATDGTGLGLVSAKGLVEAMGGTIGVASQVHHGSTFWIELPRTHEPTNQVTNTDNDWRETPGTVGLVGTVLYVEDNASNRVLMERILARRPGVRLLTAATGAVGLEVARTQLPDLILLDVHLPDILGDDVLRQLWADPVTRQIPVSVLSADATPGQIRRLLSAGARAYLTKPLDVEKVLSLVDGTLAEPSEAEVDLARGAHVRD
jgi:CheY-like chemotaxis protein